MEKIKESSTRHERVVKLIESMGGELIGFYYTMGQYDFVFITEGLSLGKAMKSLFVMGGAGDIRTETLVAFPAEDVAEVFKGLS